MKRKIILLAIFIAVLLLLFAFGYHKGRTSSKDKILELNDRIEELESPTATYTEADTNIYLDVMQEKLHKISELTTIEYLYTNAGRYEDTKLFAGMNIPLTQKSFIAKWDGTIKAGIDVSEVSISINDSNKQVIVHLPDAKIMSHEVNPDSFETLNESDGLFNKITIDDTKEFEASSRNEMEERAISNGLLNKATENAQNIIQNLLLTQELLDMGYKVVFE